MQRLLAVLLVLVGLIGLALGRLGETTWAPATEVTSSVELSEPGPAVVIDPGVLYIGGTEGEVTVTGASSVSMITASNSDIDAYLDGVQYTRITGASSWSTLSTETVNADGDTELTDPTSSDLWRTVETQDSPLTIDVADFYAGESGEDEQVYRAILLVTDGSSAGADSVSITWPVDDTNEWVPYAYAGGAAVAVVGLILLVLSLGSGRRRRGEGEIDEVEAAEDALGDDALDDEDDPEVEDDEGPGIITVPGGAARTHRADDEEPGGEESDEASSEETTDVLPRIDDSDPQDSESKDTEEPR